jgi:hypothetical protein
MRGYKYEPQPSVAAGFGVEESTVALEAIYQYSLDLDDDELRVFAAIFIELLARKWGPKLVVRVLGTSIGHLAEVMQDPEENWE